MGILDCVSGVFLVSLLAGTQLMATAVMAEDVPKVATIVVDLEDVSPKHEFVGRVEAVNTVDVRSRIDGFIDERLFEEGSLVEKDQELFRMDSRALDIALVDAKAALARAQATLLDAERQMQRNRSLNQTVARATVEQSETARDVAAATVQSAEAAVRQAELNLSYSHITSPLKGRIGTAALSAGSFVNSASPALARIVQMDPIRVVFSVSDRALLDLREAAGGASKDELARRFQTTLRLSNGQDYAQKASIQFFGNEVDEGTGTLPVRTLFSNPDLLLIPGQFVTVVVSETTRIERPTVPLGAVQQDREGKYVMLVDQSNHVAQRRITVSEQINGSWIVETGLKGGENLVVEGLQNISDGSAVQTVAGTDARNGSSAADTSHQPVSK